MNNTIKILLTFLYLIILVVVVSLIITDSKWITNNIFPFEQQIVLIALITLISYSALGYLIHRLWTFKNLHNSTKVNWTFRLLFFGIFIMPFYIWKTDNELRHKIQKTTLHNTV